MAGDAPSPRAYAGANHADTVSTYSNSGQRTKTTATGMADTLYAYDSLGRQFQSALAVNGSGAIETGGLTRVPDSRTVSRGRT